MTDAHFTEQLIHPDCGDAANDCHLQFCVLVHQRMSQFWYSDETATRLAEEAVREAGEGGR